MMIVNTVSSKLFIHNTQNTILILFFEKVLQPVSNQYNITEKIKEANSQLYKVESVTRSSQPKVRFRDHQLVDYEPEDDDVIELMEKRSNSSNSVKKEEESSDDGYIDDEVLDVVPADDRVTTVESIEFEEVCEQIEVLEMSAEVNVVNDAFESEASEEDTYAKDGFHEDVLDEVPKSVVRELKPIEAELRSDEKKRKTSNSTLTFSTKKIFRTKINPSSDVAVDGSPDVKCTPKKKCCQFKETDEYKQKLPKYNGLNSNYGLSKEEFERRHVRKLENVELKQQRRQLTVQQKEHLAQTNEAAFAKW
jgi:hypothetical protein